MQITMIKGVPVTEELPKPTNQELQNEFNYILAEQMTKKLLDNGEKVEFHPDNLTNNNYMLSTATFETQDYNNKDILFS